MQCLCILTVDRACRSQRVCRAEGVDGLRGGQTPEAKSTIQLSQSCKQPVKITIEYYDNNIMIKLKRRTEAKPTIQLF